MKTRVFTLQYNLFYKFELIEINNICFYCMESKKGKIVINYCGGWGYRPKARYIQEAVENKFPESFEIELLADDGMTGRLEVNVFIGDESEGHLVHSKAKGQGFVTDKNVDKVLDKNKIVSRNYFIVRDVFDKIGALL